LERLDVHRFLTSGRVAKEPNVAYTARDTEFRQTSDRAFHDKSLQHAPLRISAGERRQLRADRP